MLLPKQKEPTYKQLFQSLEKFSSCASLLLPVSLFSASPLSQPWLRHRHLSQGIKFPPETALSILFLGILQVSVFNLDLIPQKITKKKETTTKVI